MTDHLVGLLDRAFVRAADGGDPALWTVLAVADAVAAGAEGAASHDGPGLVSDRRRRLRHLTEGTPTTPDAGTGDGDGRPSADRPVVELGCGAGGRLGEAGEALGVDRWPALLRVARGRTGAGVVAADPARPPLRADTAGAVVSLGHLGAREPVGDLLSTAAEVAVPSGVVAVAGPGEPRAVLRGGGAVELDGYRVSWSVAAGRVREDRASVGVEYEVTSAGRTKEHVDHPTVRLIDRRGLRAAATDAGLTEVSVDREAGDWLVVSGRA